MRKDWARAKNRGGPASTSEGWPSLIRAFKPIALVIDDFTLDDIFATGLASTLGLAA